MSDVHNRGQPLRGCRKGMRPSLLAVVEAKASIEDHEKAILVGKKVWRHTCSRLGEHEWNQSLEQAAVRPLVDQLQLAPKYQHINVPFADKAE